MEDALFLFRSIYISYTIPTAVAFFPPALSKCAYLTRLGVYVPPERAGICRTSEVYHRTLSGVYRITLTEIHLSPQPPRKTDLPSAPRFTRVLLTAKLAANGKSIPSVKSLFYRSP